MHLSDKRDNSMLVSPEEMLAAALAEVRENENAPKQAIVLFLDRSGSRYDWGIRLAGFTASEVVSLLEVAKQSYVDQLNGKNT